MSKLKILFLCTGNACRSQMAEGWANTLKGDILEAASAGVTPHGLDSRAITVMSEAGVDISNHRSKDVVELLHLPFDAVVTVCDRAADACPVFPGEARRVHYGFDDPPTLALGLSEADALDVYRRVRDDIRAFIETLPHSLNLEEASHDTPAYQPGSL